MADLSFPVRVQDWQIDVARGGIMNQKALYVSGVTDNQNGGGITNLTTNLPLCDVRSVGDTVSFFAITGQQVSIISTSASDTLLGIGARQVTINYLRPDFTANTEVISLNGVTKVDSVNTDIAYLNGFYVSDIGGNESNIGVIRLQNTGNTLTYGAILTSYNNSRIGQYTVPLNNTLYIQNIIYGGGVGACAIGVKTNMIPNTNTKGTVYSMLFQSVTAGSGFGTTAIPIRIPATCTIIAMGRGISVATTGYVFISGFLE